jgi:hypothetical protein
VDVWEVIIVVGDLHSVTGRGRGLFQMYEQLAGFLDRPVQESRHCHALPKDDVFDFLFGQCESGAFDREDHESPLQVVWPVGWTNTYRSPPGTRLVINRFKHLRAETAWPGTSRPLVASILSPPLRNGSPDFVPGRARSSSWRELVGGDRRRQGPVRVKGRPFGPVLQAALSQQPAAQAAAGGG